MSGLPLTSEPSPAGRLLGRKIIEQRGGRAVVEYVATDCFLNRNGTVQGGMLAAMLDSAIGIAAATVVSDTSIPATLEMKVSFLEPALPGRFVSEATVLRAGRSILFVQGILSADVGTLLASASATVKVLDPRARPRRW